MGWSKMILDRPNHFVQVPIVLDVPNHFGQVQIIKISPGPNQNNLDLTKTIGTQPKWFSQSKIILEL